MYLSEHCCCEDDEMVSLAVSSAHIIAPFLVFLSPRYAITLADVSRDVTGIINNVIIIVISSRNILTSITFTFVC